MTATRLPPQMCPSCGYAMDAASGVGHSAGAKPAEGDLTLCIDCGAMLQFGPGLIMEPLPPEVLAEVRREDPQSARALLLGRATIRRRGRLPARGGQA